ncbi:hypothetical protein [Plantactinospora sonchi]|uniref:Flavin reductase n=1 Tax=Plantactinospora sonchi TaxID=1544735 RepID=A0ABU7RXS8_9ACTN
MGTVVMRNGTAFTNPGEHIPRRPSWKCRLCEADWPCGTAKATLRVEYRLDPLALFIYLGLCLHEATEDLHELHPNPGPDPVELHARFMAWVPVNRMIRRALLLRAYAEAARAFPPGESPGQRSS